MLSWSTASRALAFGFFASLGIQTPLNAEQSTSACELHVWTTANFNAVFHGASVRGNELELTLTPEQRAVESMRQLLAPATQEQIIKAQIPTKNSPFDGYEVIVHEAPKVSKFSNFLDKHVGEGPREVSSASPCYAELHIIGLTVYETAIYKQLQTIYVFRQFGNSATAVRTVRDAAATRPSEFKTNRVLQEDVGAAALTAAFQRAIARIWDYRKLGKT